MLRQVVEAVIRLKTQTNPSERFKKPFRSTPINNLTLITSTDHSMRFNYWKHLKEETQDLLKAESLHHNHILMISFKSHHAGVQRQEYKKIIIVLWTQHCLFNHETQWPWPWMPLDVQFTETNLRRFCGICKHLSKSGMFVSCQLEFQMLFCDTVLSRREFTGMLCIVSMERDRTSPSSYSSLSFHCLGYK